jgi:alpha-D-xyloside xylohydrolase
VVTLPFSKGEGLFGLGLQLKSVLLTGRKKTARVNSDPAADIGDSHAPVPFYVSTAGYGVLIDTARYASFYFGTHVEREQIEARNAEKESPPSTGTDELYRMQAAGRRVVVDIPAARGVDVYLFGGPTLLDAVRRYNLFSGGGCLPPLWGLGGWYRVYGQFDGSQVLDLAQRLRDQRIPMDVIGLEPGWHTHSYPCSFDWAQQRFPDPDGMMSELHKMGFKVNLWEHAFVHPKSPIYGAIREHCGDEMAFDGLVPDFLTPEARQVFRDHHDQALVSRGVDGFKLDECDHSDFIRYAWSFPEWSRFPSGADGEQMHSLFGLQYQHVIDDAYRRHDRRHYSLVRSSQALAAPMPYVLYSDLYDFDDFLRGVVTGGFSGLLWCPEVRHAVSVEDLVRRIQVVALSPMALVNGWYICLPPWDQIEAGLNRKGTRMDNADEATARVREAFELRMRLVPYLYTAFARYRRDGTPPFRALAMDWADDRQAWSVEDQYLIGDALMVAPVRPGCVSRSVYLPKGQWREFFTGRLIEGGQRVEVAVGLADIPLYVREGSILPLAQPVSCLSGNTVLEVTPVVYGESQASGWLYDDDGVSFAYEREEQGWVELAWSQGAERVQTKPVPAPRRFRLSTVAVMGGEG